MHQSLIQWHGDIVEAVPADDSVSVATADLPIWETDGIDCLSGKVWEENFLNVSDHDIKPIQAVGSSNLS